jgi:hypothetical protein
MGTLENDVRETVDSIMREFKTLNPDWRGEGDFLLRRRLPFRSCSNR